MQKFITQGMKLMQLFTRWKRIFTSTLKLIFHWLMRRQKLLLPQTPITQRKTTVERS